MKIGVSVLALIGITGMYLPQAKKAGVIGLAGYLILSAAFLIMLCNQVIAVVVLPLFIPPVVFGAGALERAASGQPVAPALAFLCAYVLFAAVVTPLAGAAAIRNAQG